MPKAKSVKPGNKQLNGIPRKRKSLTAAQKKEICLKKISTPFLKQKELANEYEAQYRKLYLHNRVKSYDNFNEYGTEPVEINIKKCIKYVARAWDSVTKTTIENCWLKADILPKDDDGDEVRDDDREHDDHVHDDHDSNDHADTQIYLTHIKELEEIQMLIDKLDFEKPFTAEEFIQCDREEITTEMIFNEEILKTVLPNNNQEEEVEEIPLPTITHNEAIEFYDKVILYLEQQEDGFDTKKEELKFVKKLKKEALKQRFISAKQTNLDSYINIIE
ncbi:unnamed protein product [Rhizophagus irregularis]|nr:unnamed protein product [Rhizophagus irregularis]